MRSLVVSILLLMYIQSNAQVILTFSGENLSDRSDLNLDSVYIQNKTNDTDTLVFGNNFSGTVSSIQNWDKNTNDVITTHPNPFKNEINILFQTPVNSDIVISAYSIDGKNIANWSGKSVDGVGKFNFKSGVEGVVFLTIKTDDGEFGTKLICLEKSSESTIEQKGTGFINPKHQINRKSANVKSKNFSFSYGDSVKIIGYHSSKPSLAINDILLDDKQYKCYFDLDGYPTRLYKLDSVKLSQLSTETPYPLDAYGLIDHHGIIPGDYSSINDTNSVIDLAKSTLIKNSKFTNVTSDSELVLKRVDRYAGPIAFTYWDVDFKNQIYNGLEVLRTEIGLRITDTVSFIYQHHFKYVNIPNEGFLPLDTIKARIIGTKIEWYDYSFHIQVQEVTDSLIVNDFAKKIIWSEKDNYLEFRVVWDFKILMDEGDPDWYVSWHIYVDVLSGEIIYIWQTFVT